MKTRSIWLESSSKCNPTNKNCDVDVLIIGGGITGISTAYHLINSNLKVCLVESNLVGHGVTSKSTAKLTFLQETVYSSLEKEKARLYLKSQKEAIDIVNKIINDNDIKCNYENVSSIVFTNNEKEVKKIKKEEELLKEFGINVKRINKLPSGEKIEYGISVNDTAVFNPIKYLNALKKICLKNGICIYENTKIVNIEYDGNYYICKANKNFIKTKYIVFATHYPYFLFPYFMPMKCYLEKSYISAFLVDNNFSFSAITSSYPTISLRYYSDKNKTYQIYLNGSHNLCNKYNEKVNFKNLINNLKVKPEYIWSNKDIMTNDRLPYIGEIKNNMYIATGYNTWGMTNGSIAGKIISDSILDKSNIYIDLFDPRRGLNLKKLSTFPLILFSNIKSFVGMKLKKYKNWYGDNIIIKKEDGKDIAIYIDDDGNEHIVYNKCPHLKCSLLFNEIEKTWDCPCHGSRFDIDGKLIEGPSNYNICYKKEL